MKRPRSTSTWTNPRLKTGRRARLHMKGDNNHCIGSARMAEFHSRRKKADSGHIEDDRWHRPLQTALTRCHTDYENDTARSRLKRFSRSTISVCFLSNVSVITSLDEISVSRSLHKLSRRQMTNQAPPWIMESTDWK